MEREETQREKFERNAWRRIWSFEGKSRNENEDDEEMLGEEVRSGRSGRDTVEACKGCRESKTVDKLSTAQQD